MSPLQEPATGRGKKKRPNAQANGQIYNVLSWRECCYASFDKRVSHWEGGTTYTEEGVLHFIEHILQSVYGMFDIL